MLNGRGGEEGLFGHVAPRLTKRIPPVGASPQDCADAVTSARWSQPSTMPATSGNHLARPAVGHLENGSFWS